MPGRSDARLWDELAAARSAGKIRHIGVSLYSVVEIDLALTNPLVDGFQVCFGLLDPLPFLRRLDVIRERRPGVIVRSVLKEGFLTGKYDATSRFTDPDDQRSRWDRDRVVRTAQQVDAMRFLVQESRTLQAAAVCYPLTFPEVSSVILSTKSAEQASTNFLAAPASELTSSDLARVREAQSRLGLLSVGLRQRARESVSALLRPLRRG
jgi:aryl-alcohol dehydrogenase-like predicted oxidoreductase